MQNRHPRAQSSLRKAAIRRRLNLRPEPLERRDLLSAGQVDTTFGNAGLATAQIGGLSTGANAVAIQTNGEIVAAGANTTSSGGQNFALARFTTAGALDTSFGAAGTVSTAFGKASSVENGVAIQPNGDVIAAGETSALNRSGTYIYAFALARYTPSGMPDSSFGNMGEVTTTVGSSSIGQALAIYPNSPSDPADAGKILVAGYSLTSNSTELAVARYNTNGTLDTSFGKGGTVLTPLAGYTGAQINAVALEPNGGVVVAGYVQATSSINREFVVAKYTENGALDTTFGGGGVVMTLLDNEPLPSGMGHDDEAKSVVIQSDGRIVAAGQVNVPLNPTPAGKAGSIPVLGLARYNTDGTLDGSFGNGGLVVDNVSTAFNGSTWNAQYLKGLALDANGNLVIGGTLNAYTVVNGRATTIYHALAGRFTPQGALDPSFGTGGLTFSPQLSGSASIDSLAIYPSPDAGDTADAGKIVLAGFTGTTRQMVAIRYLGDSPAPAASLSPSIATSESVSPAVAAPSTPTTSATDAALATLEYPLVDDSTLSQLARGRK